MAVYSKNNTLAAGWPKCLRASCNQKVTGLIPTAEKESRVSCSLTVTISG